MKYFAVVLLLAFAAVALAEDKVAQVENTEGGKIHNAKVEKVEEGARDKRGVLVGTYAAPYAYSSYSAVPVAYTGYNVPYVYSYYRSYPSYYSSPVVVY